MQKASPGWKVLVAIFSLLLTILVWQQGLQESFDRPSVSPKLALNQKEIAVLASPSLPKTFRPLFVGIDPSLELKNTLQEFDVTQLKERERLLLFAIEGPNTKDRSLLEVDFQDENLDLVKNKILESLDQKRDPLLLVDEIKFIKSDPLLYQLSCLSVGAPSDICIDSMISQRMAIRLFVSQVLPLLATLLGIALVLWEFIRFIGRKNHVWPAISSLPLSLVDMILLIAGGFVVLGELMSPFIAIPLSDFITQGIVSPTKESFKVFVGYSVMTLPPLLILWQQIKAISKLEAPLDGVMQWGLNLIPKSIFQAFKSWFMVLPFVLLASWLTTFFFGDPGGSNPLLEMVLSNKSFWSLSILFVTTVFMAPVFEEFVFRGVFLPVLVNQKGKIFAVIVSALVFALAHLSVGETPPLFVLGVGLALLRLSSGRLLPCMIMHSLWNGVTFANLLLLSS
ncbi:CPBP family intramembrane glutamic endopeptidase [Prochlorococcus marinus]|uniref:CPBP family intramembrane glutamic endopeptidase n=1 Tax=Prochlorococcus marinus TaxID=1219 RepID=UPI0022B4DB60|nr:type II CAAX endopeptidase family protein [Prochlorococcus marinus]